MYSELLNSTSATEAHLILQTNTPYLGSTQRPVSSSAFYMSTARVLKEGEINKPDLVTYIILFFFLLLTVTLIVLFINCQLKNSFLLLFLTTDPSGKRGARGGHRLCDTRGKTASSSSSREQQRCAAQHSRPHGSGWLRPSLK
uniref:Small integral membrane protein 32 n=1 Tax=Meleagris gallopavo TaxID=9103 RepID=A0A803YRR7_MELGA